VRRAAGLVPGDVVDVEVAEGRVGARVEDVEDVEGDGRA
jgi:hypothetical protein